MNWTEEKKERLSARYPTADLEKLAAELGCTIKQLVWKAGKMGIKRPKPPKAAKPNEKVLFGDRKRIGRNANPVTFATRTLVCSCALSGYTAEQTAMLTERSLKQVEEVLQESKENGWFAMVKRYRDKSERMIAKERG